MRIEEVNVPFDLLAVGLFVAVFVPSLFAFVAIVERELARDRDHGVR